MKNLLKMSLTYTKTYATKKTTARAPRRTLLPNIRMHASLSCVVLKKYYADSDHVFGALSNFFEIL
jgi:hypothetical protein